jgi:hypothetical protein
MNSRNPSSIDRRTFLSLPLLAVPLLARAAETKPLTVTYFYLPG